MELTLTVFDDIIRSKQCTVLGSVLNPLPIILILSNHLELLSLQNTCLSLTQEVGCLRQSDTVRVSFPRPLIYETELKRNK